ncbi:MAG: DUF1598 domain-containing protein [Planctomycetota bacterium]|nr:MAG: DUF1598 domain-containing protein [Planctomycetota bacterium]
MVSRRSRRTIGGGSDGSRIPVLATVLGMAAVTAGWFWLGTSGGASAVRRSGLTPGLRPSVKAAVAATDEGAAQAEGTVADGSVDPETPVTPDAAGSWGRKEAIAERPQMAQTSVAVSSGAAPVRHTADETRNPSASGRPAGQRVVATDRQGIAHVSDVGAQDREVAARIEAHAACGEFGAARALLTHLPELRRTALLQVIDKAAAGAIEAAAAPDSGTARFKEDPASVPGPAAGGSQADFQTLINLIMNETSGPWQEIDGTGGTISQFPNGVEVDPNGVLRQASRQDAAGRLGALFWQARRAAVNEDMARPSELRVVSLRRLERAVAERLEAGRAIPASMRFLAGLRRVRYVFIDRKNNDVLIAGPAGGWQYTPDGAVVSAEDGRPLLQLDDLVTVLRTFSDSGMQIFGCSFNPRPEGLRRVQQVIEKWNARGPLSSAAVRRWVAELQQALGEQDIQLYGVPPTTRVAQVIIEADYRMKLIGIGKLDGGPNVPDYFALMTPEERSAARMDALRWMLGMKYDAILHSPQRDAFEIRGPSVLCVPEDQIVTKDGQRIQTGKAGATNQRFADNFTRHYAELANRYPVFADLQNVFDLALAAALIHHECPQFERGVFAADGAYMPTVYPSATTVESVANYRTFPGGQVVVQVAGGVRGDAARFLSGSNGVLRRTVRLGVDVSAALSPGVPADRWWWDAATGK